MSFTILRTALWLLLVFAALLLVGCGEESTTSTGTLQVGLTDAVDPRLKEVVVSIKEVRVVGNGQEDGEESGLPLIASFEPPRIVNVLDLAFQQEVLGEAVIPAGNYSQVRLVLDANVAGQPPANYITLQDDTVVTLEGEDMDLTTPSGQTSGLKIVGKYEVLPGEMTAIVLDLDPAKAVHESSTGKWILKPTGIRVVEVEDILMQYGALTGVVMSGETIVEGATVSAVPMDQETPIASGLVDPADGSFRALLPAGNYVITVDAEGYEPYSSDPQVFEVVVGEDADTGVIQMTGIQPL